MTDTPTPSAILAQAVEAVREARLRLAAAIEEARRVRERLRARLDTRA